MIDNFDLIEPLLVFPKSDSFYFLQILQRKKDHPGKTLGGSNNNSRLIKAYYITSLEKLRIHKEEIVGMCNLFNARASINLNPRSFEKAAFRVLTKIADQMMNKDFYNVRKAYDSICGEYHAEMDRRWLVDIDGIAADYWPIANTIKLLHKEDYEKRKHLDDRKPYEIEAFLPSKSGYHIITQPFNLMTFQKQHPGIDVHKNNPTNLYIP